MATTNDIDQVSAEELQRRHWRAFTRDTDEAEASRLFQQRYGCPPAHIIEAGGNLLLGPIPTAGAPARADGYTTPRQLPSRLFDPMTDQTQPGGASLTGLR